MAMEKLYTVRDSHTRGITAIGYHQSRREIMLGCEDGIIKTHEADTGNLVNIFKDHKGWVTDFVYWAEPKLILSSSNDGMLLAWGAGAVVADKIQIGQPVYCMALCLRKKLIICGMSGCLRVYGLDEDRASGHYISLQVKYIAKEHTDIVKCIAYQEPRIYSAGFDQRFIVYELSYTGALKSLAVNNMAHDASISSLILLKDNENNTWCVTGSYDKTVKIWSADGKLVHNLDGFAGMVTSVCYIHRTRTLWVAGGLTNAYLYDPKTGDNVSDFIGTFQHQVGKDSNSLQLLKFFPESNQVVATTSRRNLVVWKYNVTGCLTALNCSAHVDSVAYTRKEPILIFTGDSDGTLTRWERMQSNHLMYSKDVIPLSDSRKVRHRQKIEKERLENEEKDSSETQEIKSKEIKSKHEAKTHYDFNKPIIAKVTKQKSDSSVSRMIYVEELDKLVVACEDSNIYVWGYDEEAAKVLKRMEPALANIRKLPKHFDILLRPSSPLRSDTYLKTYVSDDSVTNRVAGFVCKHILSNHQSSVTSLAIVNLDDNENGIFLVSGGWDRRICVWNLENGTLTDVFRNSSTSTASFQANERLELERACDGSINDLAYSPSRKEIAYATSDRMVYLRKFSTCGKDMVLLNTLQGHEGEVVCIKWNPVHMKWISGSEDGTIRIWNADGLNECELVLVTQSPVTAICIDSINGAIIAGIQNVIRVYGTDLYRLVQTNLGHTETVSSIQHIPERNQYVSTSWDNTVRIWNAWKPSVKKKKVPTATLR